MVGNHVHHIVLAFLVRPSNSSSFYAVLIEELSGAASSVDLVALLNQILCRLQQADLTLGTT